MLKQIPSLIKPNNLCFDGKGVVNMYNTFSKYLKLVESIKKGDLIDTPNKTPAKVKCVIRTECKNHRVKFAALKSGLLITPFHPIKINGKWIYPADIARTYDIVADYTYNFVLESDHSVIINNTECATLGHEVYGDKEIISVLEHMNGWNEGLITFSPQ